MSSEFPPRARLAQVAASLAAHLPAQFQGLISAPRYADDAVALEHLAEAEGLEQTIARMPETEARWLADLLLSRWQRIAEPVLDPAVAIMGPDEIWVGETPREIMLCVMTSGLDDDWQAEWSSTGFSDAGAGGAEIRLTVPTPDLDVEDRCSAAVRVFGRANCERDVFRARYSAPVRRIVLILDDQRRRLLLRDHLGMPGRGVRLEFDGGSNRTGPDGALDLEAAIPKPGLLMISGCLVEV